MATSAPESVAQQVKLDYGSWTHAQLLQRVTDLEIKLKEQTNAFKAPKPAESLPAVKPKAPAKAFDSSKYSTRLIALKFAYLGQNYNGFEHHIGNPTPLPTIEEEMWKALFKTKLIMPDEQPQSVNVRNSEKKSSGTTEVNWLGCEYSKCGRTDRGVSAFGQVIGVQVRSNKPVRKKRSAHTETDGSDDAIKRLKSRAGEELSSPAESITTRTTDLESLPDAEIQGDGQPDEASFDPIDDELPYVNILNRVLPPDIRVLAWCPNPPPDFSARFSCRERRYKYFFTQPAFNPSSPTDYSATVGESFLNIDAMRKAAQLLVGLHDFRNMCKIDPSKQITNFERRIYHADIEEQVPLQSPSYLSAYSKPPLVYAIVIHGSAFLWHQVRHIASLLFLVGQGLEDPTLITSLLDVTANPGKPKYEMGSDAPLVLWDCIFPQPSASELATGVREYAEHGHEDALNWIYVGDETNTEKNVGSLAAYGKWGRGGMMDNVWEVWRQRKMDEVLAAQLLDTIASLGGASQIPERRGGRIFDGGNKAQTVGKYVPVLKKERMDPVDVVNRRYAARKGLHVADTKGKPESDVGDE